MPGMGRRRTKYWEETDAYSFWRKYLAYMQRPGAVKAIKRRTHKRERREAREQLRRDDEK